MDHVLTHKEGYESLVGRLIYLSHTHHDISYAVNFMHSPSETHMDVVIRILRYLKMAPDKSLVFSKNGHLIVEGYIDADLEDDLHMDTLRTWRSKK